MMGVAPDAVHFDMLGKESGKPTGRAGKLRRAGVKLADGGWDINVPNAYYGDDPYGCTESIGQAAIRIEIEKLVRAVRAFKEDDYLLRHLDEQQRGWS
jgi:hypothetical protein